MKLRYYLRGLGIGIVVTAIVMGVTANGKRIPMTDEEILARARELETASEVLSQMEEKKAEEPEKQPTETQAKAEPEGKTETQAKAEPEGKTETKTEPKTQTKTETKEEPEGKTEAQVEPETDTKAETKPQAKTDTKAETKPEEKKKTGSVETVKTYTISIYPGEGSYTVSKKLATQGLVESADIYDQFLCQNGYDKRLCTGNYTIRAGAGAEEIAKILTGGNR